MNLIYFDEKQLEDYLFDKDYNKAYNQIVEEEDIFFWTGRVDNNVLTVLNEQGEQYQTNIKDVKNILVRGKNFPYFLFRRYTANIINSLEYHELFTSKRETKSFLRGIQSNARIPFTVPSIPVSNLKKNKTYVFKPDLGLKGEGIIIGDIADMKKAVSHTEENFIIEPFVKSKPFLGLKNYDIRVVYVRNQIPLVIVRSPKEGSLLANLAQGGSKIQFTFEEFLSKLSSKDYDNVTYSLNYIRNCMAHDIVFSIDFVLTEDGINVFEFNSYPGIRPEYTDYLKALRKLLTSKPKSIYDEEFEEDELIEEDEPLEL